MSQSYHMEAIGTVLRCQREWASKARSSGGKSSSSSSEARVRRRRINLSLLLALFDVEGRALLEVMGAGGDPSPPVGVEIPEAGL